LHVTALLAVNATVPAGAVAAMDGDRLSVRGGAATVTVKVIVLRPATDAVSVFTPGAAPSVQLPTVAMPAASVVCEAPVMVPPPVVTANVTAMPDTAAPELAVTLTLGRTETASPAAPDCVVADVAA